MAESSHIYMILQYGSKLLEFPGTHNDPPIPPFPSASHPPLVDLFPRQVATAWIASSHNSNLRHLIKIEWEDVRGIRFFLKWFWLVWRFWSILCGVRVPAWTTSVTFPAFSIVWWCFVKVFFFAQMIFEWLWLDFHQTDCIHRELDCASLRGF